MIYKTDAVLNFFSGNGEGNLWFLKSPFHVVSSYLSKSGLWCARGTWSVK